MNVECKQYYIGFKISVNAENKLVFQAAEIP